MKCPNCQHEFKTSQVYKKYDTNWNGLELNQRLCRLFDEKGIRTIEDLKSYNKYEIRDLKGMGPDSFRLLEQEMHYNGIKFKEYVYTFFKSPPIFNGKPDKTRLILRGASFIDITHIDDQLYWLDFTIANLRKYNGYEVRLRNLHDLREYFHGKKIKQIAEERGLSISCIQYDLKKASRQVYHYYTGAQAYISNHGIEL